MILTLLTLLALGLAPAAVHDDPADARKSSPGAREEPDPASRPVAEDGKKTALPAPHSREALRLREQVLTRALGLDVGQRRELHRLLALDRTRALAAETLQGRGTPGRPEPKGPISPRSGKTRRAAQGGAAGPGAGVARGLRMTRIGVLRGPGVNPVVSGLRLTTVSAFLRILRPDQSRRLVGLIGELGLRQLRLLATARRLTTPALPAGLGKGKKNQRGRGGRGRRPPF